jgi:hypothetical protein
MAVAAPLASSRAGATAVPMMLVCWSNGRGARQLTKQASETGLCGWAPDYNEALNAARKRDAA